MKKQWLISCAALAVLAAGPAAAAEREVAYGDLYNVQWCPCNPEEPFDADGAVVQGKTVMCPCDGMYSGFKRALMKICAILKMPPKTSCAN